ncbi:MAG: S8 family serine peptidase [Cytophagaceae bacterium]
MAALLFTVSCKKESDIIPAPDKAVTPPAETVPGKNVDECLSTEGWDNGSIIPDQYIIALREDSGQEGSIESVESKIQKLRKLKSSNVQRVFTGRFRGFAARLNHEEFRELSQDPSVAFIEPDRIVSVQSGCPVEISSQNIPWGIKRVGRGNGTGKRVWIIDTGIELDHPDLNVDQKLSKSFVTGTTPNDDHGHGTHVAGIIGAKDNNFGVIGVAYNATVIALKAMDHKGRGSVSNIIAAVQHAISSGKPGDVINMSLGGITSSALDVEVKNAADKGYLFAVAAGNSSVDAGGASPARVQHKNIYTVSAMDSTDTWAPFSNFGEVVDYCAPGVRIYSTFLNDGYSAMSGTSMAAPHVAGILAIRGSVKTDGFVKDDPDNRPDPIAKF